ncbi:hypothetical protein A1O3_09880 [Capronia epimyces CBS 606.96]|uniref:Uncharacterized protein n=1 Tax=Capronia epimyces CBS 606.96 TaxID=1182542 RepID=W9XKZ6_9EURO|nr:uncharacterized protein A1O3_09880 [Capronia epimyces CBS 606.96]EXJ77651.1 hypothetical protein A1O3_09880 [Capronia epimyces CBS 606.96]
MANKVKTYFLVPGWDFPADSIPLGAVIDDAYQPQPTLFTPERSTIDTKIFPTDKFDFSATISEGRKGEFGLLAKFLSVFGLGAEASLKYDRKHVETYSFQHMHTEWFEPSRKFLDAAVAQSEVAAFLEQMDYEQPVYMVTGVKTVKGAGVTTSKTRGRGWKAFFGVDGTPAGVPVAIGPKGEDGSTTSNEATFQNSSHIGFAYRLKKITCSRDKTVESTNHTAGALFGTDGEVKEITPEVDEISSNDALIVYDEGDEEGCLCVVSEGLEDSEPT